MTPGRGEMSAQQATERWEASTAFEELKAALAVVGCADVDPNPKDGRNWPHKDRLVRDAFHLEWTRRMQARSGIDPLEVTPREKLLAVWRAKRDQVEVKMVECYTMQKMSTGQIAQKFELSQARVRQVLKAHGVKIRPKHEEMTAERSEVIELWNQGFSTTNIAKRRRVSRQAIDEMLRKAGLMQTKKRATKADE
jgi:predicted DNA-binding protein YlxM (UPF0122 family)